MPDRDTVIDWLREQPEVRFVTSVAHGEAVLALTRDVDFVKKLGQRPKPPHPRWYDRTMYSTEAGAEPNWECELVFGPQFWEPEPCDHDGWQAGCAYCEHQHALALKTMGEA